MEKEPVGTFFFKRVEPQLRRTADEPGRDGPGSWPCSAPDSFVLESVMLNNMVGYFKHFCNEKIYNYIKK